MTWRLHREAALLLAGGRALLLQVAHPLVAMGVARHSNFRQDPIARLRRTLQLTLAITFDSAAAAVKAVRTIEHRHARVRGVLGREIGPFAADTRYDANDPRLLFWVHATLVDSALLAYESFLRPLGRAERQAYYDESRVTARLFGIPDDLIPPDLRAFEAYMSSMLRSDTLTVIPEAQEIAAAVLRPPLPFGLGLAFGLPAFVTVGLLPAELRERYEYSWDRAREAALRAFIAAVRAALPRLPETVRWFPEARRGMARFGTARAGRS